MWMNNMVLKGSNVGFGLTEDEAENDLYVNMCRFDQKKDSDGKFKGRRAELKPWLPTSSMLHLSDIGCLVYKSGELCNTNGNNTIAVADAGFGVFYYLSKVLGDSLSYADIMIAVQDEINKFFKNISGAFMPVQDYPIISVTSVDMAFEPDVTYFLKNGIIVGSNASRVGAKLLGTTEYYVVDRVGKVNEEGLIAYLGYRMGAEFDKGGIGLGKGN